MDSTVLFMLLFGYSLMGFVVVVYLGVCGLYSILHFSLLLFSFVGVAVLWRVLFIFLGKKPKGETVGRRKGSGRTWGEEVYNRNIF